MRVNLHLFLTFLCCTFLLSSCDQEKITPSSSGKPGEIIVVIDSLLWKSEAGQILRDTLMASFPALPQDEPLFKLITIQPNAFKSILQLHQNVLMVETGPLQDERNYVLTFKNDVWSNPQMVLNLRAVDATQLQAAAYTLASSIAAKFSDEEQQRLSKKLLSSPSNNTQREVQEKMNISIPFNHDYFIAKSDSNYLWVRKETIHVSIGFQIYRLPYVSDSQFTIPSIIAIRDSVSKLNIPGPSQGSYMTTEYQFPVSLKAVSIDSTYGVELRGLWKTEGDFMGGPFLSYLIHDKKKNELLFIDGFVYAPKFNKREYVTHIEGMVHALRF